MSDTKQELILSDQQALDASLSNEVVSGLATIQELYKEPETLKKYDHLQALMNMPPPTKWIKSHPFIKQEARDSQGNKISVPYKYLPIDKVEYLLKKIYKKYRIEILREGTAFNGVFVTVRVWYLDPISAQMEFQDGIGSMQLQTKSGSSPADLGNINNGALSMAFPAAKTLAIKDACDHLGDIFGANIARGEGVLHLGIDPKLQVMETQEMRDERERNQRLEKFIRECTDVEKLEDVYEKIPNEEIKKVYDRRLKSLKKKANAK